MNTSQNSNDRIGLSSLREKTEQLRNEISKVIVGQKSMIDLLMVAILSNGHVLLEGVPGIAKTLTVKLLARLISSGFSRIQFTPDLMPSDITGTSVFNAGTSEFEFNAGPIFSNLVLIDEINRAPAKTQSALFEVMEERQITVDGHTYNMQEPFLVFATQNPLEHEGTYRLPEAQLDRFLFKINITYPTKDEEVLILQNMQKRKGEKEIDQVSGVLTANDIIEFQKLIRLVHAEDNLLHYISDIVNKTRSHSGLYLGASPRASINTLIAGKAYAAINGRDYLIPEDVKAVIDPVLIHRIYLTPEKEMEGTTEEQMVVEIINSVEIPR